MPIINVDKLPKEFSEQAIGIFDAIHKVMRASTKVAKETGLPDNQVISAVMSATITELIKVTGCPHCAARILGLASLSISEAHEEDDEHESIH